MLIPGSPNQSPANRAVSRQPCIEKEDAPFVTHLSLACFSDSQSKPCLCRHSIGSPFEIVHRHVGELPGHSGGGDSGASGGGVTGFIHRVSGIVVIS